MPLTAEKNGVVINVKDDERQSCEIWSRVMLSDIIAR